MGTQQNISVDFPTKAAEYMHLVSTNTRSRSFYDFQASEMRIKFNKKRGTKIQCGSYYRKFISSQDSD